jgi:hypothetical protein
VRGALPLSISVGRLARFEARLGRGRPGEEQGWETGKAGGKRAVHMSSVGHTCACEPAAAMCAIVRCACAGGYACVCGAACAVLRIG